MLDHRWMKVDLNKFTLNYKLFGDPKGTMLLMPLASVARFVCSNKAVFDFSVVLSSSDFNSYQKNQRRNTLNVLKCFYI